MVTMAAGDPPPPHMVTPPCVELRPSAVTSDGALGAWCVHAISVKQRFGPYAGEIVVEDDVDEKVDFRFAWEVINKETGKLMHVVSATKPEVGNWMRYVNCARFYEEQNIVSVQEGAEVFYEALKDIKPGEELLTWFNPLTRRSRKRRRAPRSASTPDRGDFRPPPAVDQSAEPSANGKRRRKKKVDTDMLSLDDQDVIMAASGAHHNKIRTGASSGLRRSSSLPDGKMMPHRKSVAAEASRSRVVTAMPQLRTDLEGHGQKMFASSSQQANTLFSQTRTVSYAGTQNVRQGNVQNLSQSTQNILQTGMQNVKQSKTTFKGAHPKKSISQIVASITAKREAELNLKQEVLDESESNDSVSRSSTDNSRSSLRSQRRHSIVGKAEDMADSSSDFQFLFEITPAHKAVNGKQQLQYACDACECRYHNAISLKRHYLRTHVNHKYLSQDDISLCRSIYQALASVEADLDPDADDVEISNENGSHGESSSNSCKNSETETNPDIQLNSITETLAKEIQLRSVPVPGKTTFSFVGILGVEDAFRCFLCVQLFPSITRLRHHVEHDPHRSKGDKQFGCERCSVRFRFQHNYLHHIESHGSDFGTLSIPCHICGKRFLNEANMRKHLRFHSGRNFPCKYGCVDIVYPNVAELVKHLRTVHPNLPKRSEAAHNGGVASFGSTAGPMDDGLQKKRGRPKLFESKRADSSITSQPTLLHADNVEAQERQTWLESRPAGWVETRGRKPKPGVVGVHCTICKKKFSTYGSMCRHRRSVHTTQLSSSVKSETSPPPAVTSEETSYSVVTTQQEVEQEVINHAAPEEVLIRHIEASIELEYQKIEEQMERARLEEVDMNFGFSPPPSPTSFYANVAENIAENLSCYLDGGEKALQAARKHIQIDDYVPLSERPDCKPEESVEWTEYNFPPFFMPVDPVIPHPPAPLVLPPEAKLALLGDGERTPAYPTRAVVAEHSRRASVGQEVVESQTAQSDLKTAVTSAADSKTSASTDITSSSVESQSSEIGSKPDSEIATPAPDSIPTSTLQDETATCTEDNGAESNRQTVKVPDTSSSSEEMKADTLKTGIDKFPSHHLGEMSRHVLVTDESGTNNHVTSSVMTMVDAFDNCSGAEASVQNVMPCQCKTMDDPNCAMRAGGKNSIINSFSPNSVSPEMEFHEKSSVAKGDNERSTQMSTLPKHGSSDQDSQNVLGDDSTAHVVHEVIDTILCNVFTITIPENPQVGTLTSGDRTATDLATVQGSYSETKTAVLQNSFTAENELEAKATSAKSDDAETVSASAMQISTENTHPHCAKNVELVIASGVIVGETDSQESSKLAIVSQEPESVCMNEVESSSNENLSAEDTAPPKLPQYNTSECCALLDKKTEGHGVSQLGSSTRVKKQHQPMELEENINCSSDSQSMLQTEKDNTQLCMVDAPVKATRMRSDDKMQEKESETVEDLERNKSNMSSGNVTFQVNSGPSASTDNAERKIIDLKGSEKTDDPESKTESVSFVPHTPCPSLLGKSAEHSCQAAEAKPTDLNPISSREAEYLCKGLLYYVRKDRFHCPHVTNKTQMQVEKSLEDNLNLSGQDRLIGALDLAGKKEQGVTDRTIGQGLKRNNSVDDIQSNIQCRCEAEKNHDTKLSENNLDTHHPCIKSGLEEVSDSIKVRSQNKAPSIESTLDHTSQSSGGSTGMGADDRDPDYSDSDAELLDLMMELELKKCRERDAIDQDAEQACNECLRKRQQSLQLEAPAKWSAEDFEKIRFGKNGKKGLVYSVCSMCHRYYGGVDFLIRHQSAKHPSIQCSHMDVELGHNLETLFYLQPSTHGILAQSVLVPPEHLNLETYTCTRCKTSFKQYSRLRSHILNCDPNAPTPPHIRKKKLKQKNRHRFMEKMFSGPSSDVKPLVHAVTGTVNSTSGCLRKGVTELSHNEQGSSFGSKHLGSSAFKGNSINTQSQITCGKYQSQSNAGKYQSQSNAGKYQTNSPGKHQTQNFAGKYQSQNSTSKYKSQNSPSKHQVVGSTSRSSIRTASTSSSRSSTPTGTKSGHNRDPSSPGKASTYSASSQDSATFSPSTGRGRKRRNYELLYNPAAHVRRRETAECLEVHQCRGCSLRFKTLSLLERHASKCSGKEKLQSQRPVLNRFMEPGSKKHPCHYCDKRFTYLKGVANHYRNNFCRMRLERIARGLLSSEDLKHESDLQEAILRQIWNKTENRDHTDVIQGRAHLHDDGTITPTRRRGGWPKGVKRGSKRRRHGWTYIKRRKTDGTSTDRDGSSVASSGAEDQSGRNTPSTAASTPDSSPGSATNTVMSELEARLREPVVKRGVKSTVQGSPHAHAVTDTVNSTSGSMHNGAKNQNISGSQLGKNAESVKKPAGRSNQGGAKLKTSSQKQGSRRHASLDLKSEALFDPSEVPIIDKMIGSPKMERSSPDSEPPTLSPVTPLPPNAGFSMNVENNDDNQGTRRSRRKRKSKVIETADLEIADDDDEDYSPYNDAPVKPRRLSKASSGSTPKGVVKIEQNSLQNSGNGTNGGMVKQVENTSSVHHYKLYQLKIPNVVPRVIAAMNSSLATKGFPPVKVDHAGTEEPPKPLPPNFLFPPPDADNAESVLTNSPSLMSFLENKHANFSGQTAEKMNKGKSIKNLGPLNVNMSMPTTINNMFKTKKSPQSSNGNTLKKLGAYRLERSPAPDTTSTVTTSTAVVKTMGTFTPLVPASSMSMLPPGAMVTVLPSSPILLQTVPASSLPNTTLPSTPTAAVSLATSTALQTTVAEGKVLIALDALNPIVHAVTGTVYSTGGGMQKGVNLQMCLSQAPIPATIPTLQTRTAVATLKTNTVSVSSKARRAPRQAANNNASASLTKQALSDTSVGSSGMPKPKVDVPNFLFDSKQEDVKSSNPESLVTSSADKPKQISDGVEKGGGERMPDEKCVMEETPPKSPRKKPKRGPPPSSPGNKIKSMVMMTSPGVHTMLSLDVPTSPSKQLHSPPFLDTPKDKKPVKANKSPTNSAPKISEKSREKSPVIPDAEKEKDLSPRSGTGSDEDVPLSQVAAKSKK